VAAFERLVLAHFKRYPQMRPKDLVKLAYQSALGCGHLAADRAESLAIMTEEYASLAQTARGGPLFESIGPGLCRLHLGALAKSGISLQTASGMFVCTSGRVKGSIAALEKMLAAILSLCQSKELPFDARAFREYVDRYRAAGFPPVRHSDEYRAAYFPAYRVVLSDFRRYAEIFRRIDRLLSEKGRALVAIDGGSGAGKSTLSGLIADVYCANLFHMDDFFLPKSRKTALRLSQPGGNVDYERFGREVLQNLALGRETFQYRAYDCRADCLGEPVRVKRRAVSIVEGVYSLHPQLSGAYDLRVFMDISPRRQSARILRRSGPELFRRFTEEWIPMENRYFEAFSIRKGCDLVYVCR